MNSNVETKSFLFSVRVVKLARYLQEEKKERDNSEHYGLQESMQQQD